MKTNFFAIGRITNECIFIHKDDIDSLIREGLTHKVRCIAIDFEEKRVSRPVIIDVLLKFCPHDEIYSEGERSVINDLILYHFSDGEIEKLNETFDRIKYSRNQTGRDTEYQSEEPQQTD
ncbi:MAG: hypothetical protein NT055_04605 [Nitrospirae bacterium]|nr:hypothetical protein [Nitrospirota bacterium]